MRFGIYFEIILNKNGYFHVEIHRSTNYSCTHMLGSSGHMLAPLRKFCKYCAVWCVLGYILIRLCIENSLKINIFLYKTSFLYKPLCLYRYTLAIGCLATGEILKNMLQLKRFGLYIEGIMNRK